MGEPSGPVELIVWTPMMQRWTSGIGGLFSGNPVAAPFGWRGWFQSSRPRPPIGISCLLCD